jgi:phosphoglycerate dehydrogenase-like enzyme
MRMNKGICIVNVSRGSVVNEDAMIKAIAQGEIRGAILDVLNKEPISRFSKIRRLPNIVITPHIAGNIDLVYQDIARHFKGTIINRINV